MECKCKITTPLYFREDATIRYEDEQLVFLFKPLWVRLLFGVIGEALASEKEKFRLNLSEVNSVKLSYNRKGSPIYQMLLHNGEEWHIVFDCHCSLTTTLKKKFDDKLVTE